MEPTAQTPDPPSGLPVLDRVERRVLGVLAEKGLTTPEYYPLTMKALLAGCNQKSNRDPVTRYREEDVEDAITRLKAAGLVNGVIGMTGRALRYRQDLGRVHGLDATEIAIVGELLLRGPQSEGDLRARANRMRPIPDQNALRERLAALADRPVPFVVRLSPRHVQRGVRWTHCLGPESERERDGMEVRSSASAIPSSAGTPSPAAGSESMTRPGLSRLEERMADLEARVAALEGRSRDS